MALTFEDIKKLSLGKKLLLLLVVFLLLSGLYFSYLYQPLSEKRGRLSDRMDNLQMKIIARRRVAKQIEKHKADIIQLKKDLNVALAKLPERKEIPPLLTSVSRAGIDAGLDFVLFQPVAPVPRDFYAEIPVKIIVDGKYGEIIRFFDGVARLPRIVNIMDISVSRKGGSPDTEMLLTTSCTIKTYMFLEKADEDKNGKKKT